MGLELVEINRPPGERFWHPFSYEEAGLGFAQQWWYRGPIYSDSRSVFLRALEDGIEVGRFELNPTSGADHYDDVPPLGDFAFNIAFFEVHSEHRLRGLGTALVDLLQQRYPKHRFIAFSEQADDFWDSLGWSRHLHSNIKEARRYRPLYVQQPYPSAHK